MFHMNGGVAWVHKLCNHPSQGHVESLDTNRGTLSSTCSCTRLKPCPGIPLFKPTAIQRQGTLKQSDGHLNINQASSYDAGLFTPLKNFRSFSDTQFSTFGHPAFPQHSVRIKKNPKDFCDSTVRFVAFTIYEYFSFAWRV